MLEFYSVFNKCSVYWSAFIFNCGYCKIARWDIVWPPKPQLANLLSPQFAKKLIIQVTFQTETDTFAVFKQKSGHEYKTVLLHYSQKFNLFNNYKKTWLLLRHAYKASYSKECSRILSSLLCYWFLFALLCSFGNNFR